MKAIFIKQLQIQVQMGFSNTLPTCYLCCGIGSGEDIKPALIGWAREVLLWLRRLECWLEANVIVEVFPVPGSRATIMVLRVATTGRGRIRWDLTSCGGPTRWNTLLEEKEGGCCGTGSGKDIKPALIGWAREVLLWLRRLERWLEANVFVEVFPVPVSRATIPVNYLESSSTAWITVVANVFTTEVQT